jgi:tellurite resistance protein TehA-like permease
MNIVSLLIASLISAVVTTALSNIPYLNLINCLLCAGFWAGAILAAWVYKRLTGSLTLRQSGAIFQPRPKDQ